MKPSKRPFLIALTGGIASGKSIALDVFRQHRFTIYEADKIGHEMLLDDNIIERIKEQISAEIVESGTINREKLGMIVFENPEKRRVLNSILHPLILKKMQSLIETCSEDYLVFEIPLLFEAKLDGCFDLNVLIYCSVSKQIERLSKRNSSSEIDARRRISSQMKTLEKQKRADVIIANNNSIEQLKTEISLLIKRLDSFSYKNVEKLTSI